MVSSCPEPLVGIFWRFRRRLVIDATPLSSAELYGFCLTHPRGHHSHWTDLQNNGQVPKDVEYEEPPRGRVLFDKRRDRFVLLADRCILSRRDVVRQIMTQMHLPEAQTDVDTDAHYRCSKCLARSTRMDRD
jgi:hypothetical protein